jgi:hypothetical protein
MLTEYPEFPDYETALTEFNRSLERGYTCTNLYHDYRGMWTFTKQI